MMNDAVHVATAVLTRQDNCSNFSEASIISTGMALTPFKIVSRDSLKYRRKKWEFLSVA
jgi:hypothetical protein